MVNIKKISSTDKDFVETLQECISSRKTNSIKTKNIVKNIIEEVRNHRDKALIKFSKDLDNFSVKNINELEISRDMISSSINKITKEELEALKFAKKKNTRIF